MPRGKRFQSISSFLVVILRLTVPKGGENFPILQIFFPFSFPFFHLSPFRPPFFPSSLFPQFSAGHKKRAAPIRHRSFVFFRPWRDYFS